MLVKICGVTNREDAVAAVEAGAGAIGLNFYRNSPRYVSPTGAAMIAANLPGHVLKVGVFVDDSPEAIARITLQAGLDVAQLHGIAACNTLPTWRAVPVSESLGELNDETAEAFLLDAAAAGLHGGTGKTFDWSLARRAAETTSKKIVIAGGLDETNVRAAIQVGRPWGVDVCSRIESAPGRKDHQKMRAFIDAALTTNL